MSLNPYDTLGLVELMEEATGRSKTMCLEVLVMLRSGELPEVPKRMPDPPMERYPFFDALKAAPPTPPPEPPSAPPPEPRLAPAPPTNGAGRPFDSYKFREYIRHLKPGMEATAKDICDRLHMTLPQGAKVAAYAMRDEGWVRSDRRKTGQGGFRIYVKPRADLLGDA